MKTNVLPANCVPLGAGRSSFMLTPTARKLSISLRLADSEKNSCTPSAILGPISVTSSSSSVEAEASFSIEPKCAGEELSGALADERDADAVDEALEAVLFARGDFIEEILGGFFGHALEIRDAIRDRACRYRRNLSPDSFRGAGRRFFRLGRRYSWRGGRQNEEAIHFCEPDRKR